MQVRVLYFARLRERFEREAEILALPPEARVADLLAVLRGRGGVWHEALSLPHAFRVAVNHELVAEDRPLRSGDEVAVFPPVTGG